MAHGSPAPITEPGVRIDLGCGRCKKDGFLGFDIVPYGGVDVVCDLNAGIPIADGVAAEVYASHFLEHVADLDFMLREIHRVAQPGALVTLVLPYVQYQGGFYPGHRWFLGESFFEENVVFQELFEILEICYDYVQPAFDTALALTGGNEELAREMFWNTVRQFTVRAVVKKPAQAAE